MRCIALVYALQEHPESSELRVGAAVRQLGIYLTSRTIRRNQARNHRLNGMTGSGHTTRVY